jgi:LysR family nitrogen assimilation transcriptional regulator
METRQLNYFLVACQQQNQALAAHELAVSQSTLSQSINDLEQELGLELFSRSATGHHATLQARLMYQAIEATLRRLVAAERYLRQPALREPIPFRMTSPLRFSIGRISKAAMAAANTLEQIHPELFFNVKFSPPASMLALDAAEEGIAAPESDLTLDYEDAADETGSEVICRDPWVFVLNPQGGGDGGKSESHFEAIRNAPVLSLPDLPPLLIASAHRFCRALGLPEPHESGADAGSLVEFATASQPQFILMPQSMISNRIIQHRLTIVPLAEAPANHVVARYGRRHPMLQAYVAEIRKAIVAPERNNVYSANITMRQLRYFLAVAEHLNLTTAAKLLNVTQPAISAQLGKIESLVGRKLFERQQGGLVPAQAVRQAQSMLREAMSAAEMITNRAKNLVLLRRDRLAVGIIPFAERNGLLVRAFSGLVTEWNLMHPTQELQILVAPSTVLHLWVKTRQVDFAFVEDVDPRFPRLDLHSRDQLVLVTGARTSMPLGDTITLRDAAALPLVLPSRRFGLRVIIDRAANSDQVRITPAIVSDSLVLTLALIESGQFATIMPFETIRENVARGEVVCATIDHPVIWRELSIIYSADHALSEPARQFITRFRNMLSEAKATSMAEPAA